MRFLVRLILVPLGIGLAALAALAVGSIGAVQGGYGQGFADFLAAAGFSMILATIAGTDPDSVATFMGGLLMVSGGILVLPVVVMAVLGETFGLTSWIAYVLGSGAIYGAIPVLFPGSPPRPGMVAEVPGEIGLGFAAMGFAAGAVYWFVAGRGARPRLRPATVAAPASPLPVAPAEDPAGDRAA